MSTWRCLFGGSPVKGLPIIFVKNPLRRHAILDIFLRGKIKIGEGTSSVLMCFEN